MARKLYLPFVWLVVFMMVVGLACSVQLTNEKATPTKTAPSEKPTRRPTATEAAATKVPTKRPEITLRPPTDIPEPTKENAVTATEAPQAGDLGNPDASASGEAYFVSEFNSADNWHLLSVPETNSSKYQAYTEGGFLYLEIQPKGVTLYSFYDLVLNNPDVLIETYAQKVAGPNTNNLSLICRRSDAGWYEFSMTSGGYWYIWLYNNKKYSILTKGASTAIQMQGRPNQIQATCLGKTLTFSINGVQVGSVIDRTFLGGGQVGVSIYAEYPGLGVEFDWFRATVP
jgi:hypothetical protein